MGESGGGGLAAALALLVRDSGTAKLAAQILIYPMLDHGTGTDKTPIENPTTGEFGWSREANRFGWNALRCAFDLGEDRLAYFSPARAKELAGLPPTYISVGALDLFLDEDVSYALRLSRAGVAIECHVYPGAIHGFDFFETTLSRQFTADLDAGLRRLLAWPGLAVAPA